MIETKIKITTEEALFYAYFILMTAAKGIGLVSGNPVYNLCLVLGTLLVLTKVLIGRYTIREYLLIGFLLLLGLVIWWISANQAALICLTLVVSMKQISTKKTFRVGAFIWGSCFIFQILTQLLNLRTRDFVIHNKYHLGYQIRWALGYSHPNVLQIAYMVLLGYLAYAMVWKERKLWKAFILSLAGALYIFLYSISITGMLYFAVFWMLIFYFDRNRRKGRKRSRIETCMLELIFPAAVGFSVLGPVLLTGKAFDIINKLMTTRPALSRRFITEYGMSLFGQNFTALPAAMTLDCSYVHQLAYNGMVLFGLMCIGYILMIHYSLWEQDDRDNDMILVIILSSVIAGISEPFLFNESFKNLSLIFLGSWMMNRTSTRVQRTFRIIPVKEREYVVSCDRIIRINEELREAWQRGKKCILLIALICAVAGGVCYLQTVHLPGKVYALRSSCDTEDDSVSLFLTSRQIEQLRADDKVWVLNYKDSATPMLEFGENILVAEKIRGIVSSAIWCAAAGGMVAILILKKKKGENK